MYQTQLERVATRLATVPGRFSEANVARLGSLNHFETFKDMVDGHKRLSLSGSIVVLDIDLNENQVESVSISLASNNSSEPPTYLQEQYDPNGCILRSLRLPRLDQFTQILEFLSRCDRYSTKDVDCFHALDSIAKSVKHKAESSNKYGTFQINPGCMGTALKYHREKLAFIDIMAGNDRKYALVGGQWLDDDGEWIVPKPCQHDVRAQLVLRLEPPVVIPEYLSREWNASSSPSTSILSHRRVRSSFNVARHPAFCGVETSDTFDSTFANLIPCKFVTVSQIPLEHPKDIPDYLDRLRQFSFLEEFALSLDIGEPIFYPNDMDISIADVIEFKDKPPSTQLIPVDVICENKNKDILVKLSIPDAKCVLKVSLPASNEPEVDITGAVNLHDLHKIVNTGNLALVASYIVGYLGVKHHRMSVSLT